MHDFQLRDGFLCCEECKVLDIIKEVGTPAYIYSSKTILEHYGKIQTAFAGYPTQICYSVKANSNTNILSLLRAVGSGADIVSGGELYRCLKAGIPSDQIVYSGAGKTDAEIEYALKSDILFFNIESIPELHRVAAVAERMKTKARIAIRVNPDIDAGTHQYTTTAKKENKFGLSIDEIEAHYRVASQLANIEVHGIDVHLGSPILQLDPYLKALDVLAQAIDKLKRGGIRLQVLDLGGGLGIVYHEESAFTAKHFAEAVLPKVKQIGLKLLLEPGRFIVGNAGILAARVTYVKKTKVKTFVITDAGMNDLIRPPLYGSYHEIQSVVRAGHRPLMRADIVGPICESADFFAKDREIPEVAQDEYLAIMSAGAYGFSMSSNYNSRPRAAEVMVEKDSWRIIRRRETYADLVAPELEASR